MSYFALIVPNCLNHRSLDRPSYTRTPYWDYSTACQPYTYTPRCRPVHCRYRSSSVCTLTSDTGNWSAPGYSLAQAASSLAQGTAHYLPLSSHDRQVRVGFVSPPEPFSTRTLGSLPFWCAAEGCQTLAVEACYSLLFSRTWDNELRQL